ncbi:MAG: hypothetical protein LUH10_12260 [Tannerellaceae bacterium]|nr:hypothetical protein [Tannerellaceae bacterium]
MTEKDEKNVVVNDEATLLDVNELLEIQGGITAGLLACSTGETINCSSGAVHL